MAATEETLPFEAAQQTSHVLIIAHRGASGYVPEHTQEAVAMAHALRPDYLEQDLVLSRDGQILVLHDIYLDTVTDVAVQFPDRARENGRFYAIDFDLSEIRRLRVTERFDPATGAAVYPLRFPVGKGNFRVATFEETLDLIHGLNVSTGRRIGIYPEIKAPRWHREHGLDISRKVLAVLAQYGYSEATDPVFLQCFDPVETRRLREELGTRLRLVQLIAENRWNEAPVDFVRLRTAAGIAEIAEYADAIGPWIPHILRGLTADGQPILSNLVELAHAHGLKVHAFTMRKDALPPRVTSYQQLFDIMVRQAGVDGLFTDFVDAHRQPERLSLP